MEVLTLIERLRDDFKVPIVYVSHSVDEVARLASPVVVFNAGHVVAAGAVDEVFGARRVQAGESRFARSSVLAGRIVGMRPDYGLTEIRHPAGTIWIAGPAGAAGREVRVVVQATDVTVVDRAAAASEHPHRSCRQGRLRSSTRTVRSRRLPSTSPATATSSPV